MKEVYDWMNVNDISIVKMGIENIIFLWKYDLDMDFNNIKNY